MIANANHPLSSIENSKTHLDIAPFSARHDNAYRDMPINTHLLMVLLIEAWEDARVVRETNNEATTSTFSLENVRQWTRCNRASLDLELSASRS